MDISVLLMAGGRGTRFWPMSREQRPKQLLHLFHDESMISQTVRRLEPMVATADVLVITSHTIENAVREDLHWLPPENIIGEPKGCNTAPCVALGALICQARYGPDHVMTVLPADHYIGDQEGYLRTLERAAGVAAEGYITTVGIQPTHPETGYGYLECGADLPQVAGAFELNAFVEKPDAAKAFEYLTQGRHLWNSGMFFFRVDTILEEFKKNLPEVLECFENAMKKENASQVEDALEAAYESMPSISIDYGIMEKCRKIAAVRGDFLWSDIGSWRALLDLREDNNSSFLQGNIISKDCSDSVLIADEGITLATLGVEGLAVVACKDITLVVPLERAQEVRMLADQFQTRNK